MNFSKKENGFYFYFGRRNEWPEAARLGPSLSVPFYGADDVGTGLPYWVFP